MASELIYELVLAFCLMLIIEGIIPFVYPARWRSLVTRLGQMDDYTLRIIGLVSMLIGLLGLYIVR